MGLFDGCGCNGGNNGCDSWIWILILLCCCGGEDGICGIVDDILDNSCIIWIIILFCICGKHGKNNQISGPCGC